MIDLDIQAVRERPPCGGCDSLLICIWQGERSVTDIWQTVLWLEAVKLIKSRGRCGFELRATSGNLL